MTWRVSRTMTEGDDDTIAKLLIRRKSTQKGQREERARESAMAAKQALQKALDPIWNWASRRYQAAVAKELKKYGLRYDDLYDDLNDLDIKEALNRLPQQEVDLRNQRLKRAMDYSMKHTYMPKDLQKLQTPYEPYLQDALQLVKEERREHAELGSELPYARSLP